MTERCLSFNYFDSEYETFLDNHLDFDGKDIAFEKMGMSFRAGTSHIAVSLDREALFFSRPTPKLLDSVDGVGSIEMFQIDKDERVSVMTPSSFFGSFPGGGSTGSFSPGAMRVKEEGDLIFAEEKTNGIYMLDSRSSFGPEEKKNGGFTYYFFDTDIY